jgi:hypothetical protein
VHILVTLVPVIMNDEQKTKPTQAAMRDVLSTGLKPDLVCESSPETLALLIHSDCMPLRSATREIDYTKGCFVMQREAS